MRKCKNPIKAPFKCSRCGWEDHRKKPYDSDYDNKYFSEAIEILCPRNICKETYGREVLKGYTTYWSFQYAGWEAVVKKPKVMDIEEVAAIHRAKELCRIGAEILKNDPRYNKESQE